MTTLGELQVVVKDGIISNAQQLKNDRRTFLNRVEFSNYQTLYVSDEFLLPGVDGFVLAANAYAGLTLLINNAYPHVNSSDNLSTLNYVNGFVVGSHNFDSVNKFYTAARLRQRHQTMEICQRYLTNLGYIAEIDYSHFWIQTDLEGKLWSSGNAIELVSYLAGLVDACGRVSGKKIHIDFRYLVDLYYHQNLFAALSIYSSISRTNSGKAFLNIWTGAGYLNSNLLALYSFSNLIGKNFTGPRAFNPKARPKNPYTITDVNRLIDVGYSIDTEKERVINLGFITTIC